MYKAGLNEVTFILNGNGSDNPSDTVYASGIAYDENSPVDSFRSNPFYIYKWKYSYNPEFIPNVNVVGWSNNDGGDVDFLGIMTVNSADVR